MILGETEAGTWEVVEGRAAVDPLASQSLDTAVSSLDLVGVFICGLLGGVVARAEGLDLFGYLTVGTVSGLGGGIIRDTLLQRGTPVALTDAAYLPTAFAGAFLAFLLSVREEEWNKAFVALDAAVIGCWAVVGAQKTLAAGLGWLPAVLLGTVSAVGGGAVRDLLLRHVPAVFGGNELYATVAAVVAGTYVICANLHVPVLGVVCAILLALVFRTSAHRWGWQLPRGLPLRPATPFRAARAKTSRMRPTARRSSRRKKE